MASINTRTTTPAPRTHEGAIAVRLTPLQELRRLTMACMLWEDNFYVDGKSIADRIAELVHKVTLAEASATAIEARNNMKLRHVPLLIVRFMATHPKRVVNPTMARGQPNDPLWISKTLAEVIQRPDELTEFLAIYWKDGKQPLSKQVKLGLAKAFTKFNEYQLAKYNRKKDITLRDVLFLCHSKPADIPIDEQAKHGAHKWDKAARRVLAAPEQYAGQNAAYLNVVRPHGFSQGELLYGKLIYDQLATPDTWEVELSAGKDKKETFERLMADNKLGDLAFLRNLRNMTEAGISKGTIAAYGDRRSWGRVLPFRFIAAARIVAQMEPELERWMFKCLEGATKLPGHTRLFVDVSGSMSSAISAKSDLRRIDAAKALAMLLRELCDSIEVIPYNTAPKVCPPRRGFALGDAIGAPSGGTHTGQVYRVSTLNKQATRDIIITDEQSADPLGNPNSEFAYVINVAAHRNGIGYGEWIHIDGWSEAVVDYIQQYEAQ